VPGHELPAHAPDRVVERGLGREIARGQRFPVQARHERHRADRPARLPQATDASAEPGEPAQDEVSRQAERLGKRRPGRLGAVVALAEAGLGQLGEALGGVAWHGVMLFIAPRARARGNQIAMTS